MVPLPDLGTLSREALETLVRQQHAQLVSLEQRLQTLEQKLAGGGSGKGVPGTKPASQQRTKATGQPRKRRGQGFARRRAAQPTRQQAHAASQCPDCGAALAGGWVKRRREVIELVPAPVEVIEHVVVARRCSGCGRVVVPRVDLQANVSGHQRLGAGLVSLIVTLREAGRWPVRRIQWYLQAVHGLRLSVGAIIAASARVAAAGAGAVRALQDQIRASPVVHADETGWRENGQNGYVWTFSTPTARLFVHGDRSAAMLDRVLDETFSGVLVSDFYAVYHHYPGLKQRCWVHLLRAIHELRQLYPAAADLARWAEQVHALYGAAVALAGEPLPAAERQRAQQAAEQRLAALCTPYASDVTALQRRLCQRMVKHLPELFVFLREPAVPADNNAAERSLRHLVVSRKISGGTRSADGTATKMALTTLFGTWLLLGKDLLKASRELLLAPQL
jgi:transposase